jgi:hypothetical protein
MGDNGVCNEWKAILLNMNKLLLVCKISVK